MKIAGVTVCMWCVRDTWACMYGIKSRLKIVPYAQTYTFTCVCEYVTAWTVMSSWLSEKTGRLWFKLRKEKYEREKTRAKDRKKLEGRREGESTPWVTQQDITLLLHRWWIPPMQWPYNYIHPFLPCQQEHWSQAILGQAAEIMWRCAQRPHTNF